MSPAAPAAAPQSAGAALPILLFIVFLGLMGFGTVLPLLPFYGPVFGAPAWQITLLFSIFSFGQFFGELTWGRISDRVGRRPVLLGTMSAAAVCFFGFAFAPDIWTAIALRGLCGFFTGNVSAVQGYIADISPREKLTGRLGLMGTVFGVGFVIGPVLGGVLAHPEAGAAGVRPPVLAAASLYVLAAVCVLLFLKESRRQRDVGAAPASQLAALKGAMADPVVRKLLLLTFISFSAFSAVMPSMGLWGQDRFGWAPRDMGAVMGVMGVAGALSQWIFYRTLGRRISELLTIGGSLLLAAVFLALLAFSPSTAAAAVVLSFAVVGHMISQPATSSLISRLSHADHQGSVLGANMAVGALARVSGPMIAGAAISGFGLAAPFPMAAAMLLPTIWLAHSAARSARADEG